MNNLVEIKNNQVVVSSRKIAMNFSKRDGDILRTIKGLMHSTQNCVEWFSEEKYKDNSGKYNVEYMMNRDGFILLIMGFTGKIAIELKIAYINAFNDMEAKLQSQQLLQQSVNNIRLDPHNVEFKNMLKKMQKYLLTLQTLFETWPCSYRTQKEYEGYYDIILEHILDMSREMISFKEIKFKTGTLLEELKFNKKTL